MEVALLIIMTGFFWGLGPIMDKYGLASFSPENAILIRIISAAVLISSLVFVISNPRSIVREFNLPAFLALVGSGIVGFAGVYTFYRVIQIPGVQVAKSYAISLAVCPLVTAILAYIFYSEPIFRPVKIGGLVFVALGIYLLSYQSHP